MSVALERTDAATSDTVRLVIGTGCRRAGWATVLVVLLDHIAEFADVLVPDATYGASCAVDGLDADAVLRVGDGRGFDEDVGNGVVEVAADGVNG